MSRMTNLTALTTVSIAICLQLVAATALAQEVCVDGDTVLGIKNLEVVTDQYGVITIDVDFRYATGYEVYGSGLDNFPFKGANTEEDIAAVEIQINDVLGAANPVPGNAGQPGQDVYFIGGEEDDGFVAAFGSENLSGSFWDPCTMANDCIAGAAVLAAGQRFTYADLNRAGGGTCDGAPNPDPGPTFTITPGITGSWYDPARDGEGYNIEIIGSSLDLQMLAYFYTYDDAGNQMWLIAQGPVDGNTATLPALVASGAMFGDDFNPDDVVLEDWGTLTFTFTSCDAGTASWNSTMGFGSGTANIVRLSSVTGSTCP